MLKAYVVYDTAADECYETVVFAETRNEARTLALRTDACEYAEYKDIRAIRRPELDGCYRGKWEMDWDDPQDRIDLVKLAGFECSWEIDLLDLECDTCPAREWCDRASEREEELK